MIEIYESDDLTAVVDLAIPNVEAGADSDTVELHIWNSKGEPLGQEAVNLILLLQTESPTSPGTWLSAGIAPQDELWGRVRVIGVDNAAAPAWSVPTTAWRVWGAYSGLVLERIPPDCAVHLELRLHPPGFATSTSYRFRVAVATGEYARPVPPLLAAVDRGVLTGVGDGAASHLLRGGEVTASSPEDEEVHVAALMAVLSGAVVGRAGEAVVLDQDDGATPTPATLAAGESYLAALTLTAAGLTATKGLKGVAPTPPTPPPGLLLAIVAVAYQAGGTSAIAAGDVDGRRPYGRLHAEPGSGLAVTVYPGEALAGGTWRYRSGPETLSGLADDADLVIWQLASGLLEVATAAAGAPETTSLPLWAVTTAAGDVALLVDRRPWAGRSRLLRAAGSAAATGLVDELLVEDPELQLEAVVVRVSDNGGGASGATVVDVEVGGASIYDDPGDRPAIAFDAVDLVDRDSIPVTTVLRHGDLVAVHIDALPVGGSPDRVEVQLVCRVA